MYRTCALLIVFLFVCGAGAQTINLKGKVLNGSGRPISGAVVALIGKNLKDTTDANGAYSINAVISSSVSISVIPAHEYVSLTNGVISLAVPKTTPVSIKMFDMKGNLLKRLVDGQITAGKYIYKMTSVATAEKLVVVCIEMGNKLYTFRWLPMTGVAAEAFGAVGKYQSGYKVSKLTAIVDSLKVTASGYIQAVKAIESYQGEVNFTLDSIKLEKFSFFVTSLAGLQRLSGSEKGFGGDLRFGKTGPGAGLLGADSICECLAESSMPGSRVKQWRAFLSVTKGPDGKPVNAIDRIGTGPWYDRLGRLVSNTIQDLLNERPNADPEIKNDLPNEDGIPNHRPDPTQPAVDNHQMITGSGTDGKLRSSDPSVTCQDWTSAAADGGKPSCGLSWPQSFGGGGGGRTGGRGKAHWIYVWELWGCEPGVDFNAATGKGTPGVTTIGNGGGYGGFYCFALNP